MIQSTDGFPKPKLNETPNLDALIEELKAYVDFIDSDEYYTDDDSPQYIFETVMETFYGKRFWLWFNSK